MVHRAFALLRLDEVMDYDPVLGAAIWIACTLGFLTASAALVRMLDEGTLALAGAAGRLALDDRITDDERAARDNEEGIAY